MKTFEEVELHLFTTGYKSCELDKICGYLIGVGVKEPSVKFKILLGDGTFDDFYAWFNEEPIEVDCECPNCILCGLMRDIAEKMEHAETMAQKEYFAAQLQFLVDKFCLDELDGE